MPWSVCVRSWPAALTVAAIAFACVQPLVAGAFDGWNRRLSIAYANYDGATLTNFPVLVKLSEDIVGFYYDEFRSPTGGDLRFADGVSSNELVYEVDEWNMDGTSLVWVQLPVLTSNTTIHAFWGNPAQTTAPGYTTDGSTWTNGHIGVWHMKEPGNAPADSALQPRDNSGTDQGTDGIVVDARIGKGYDYSGTGRVDIVNRADLAGLGEATLMLWFYKRSRGGANYGTIFGRNNTHNFGVRHHSNPDTQGLDMRLNSFVVGPGDIGDGEWHFLAYTYDDAGDRVEAFLNGTSAQTATSTQGWIDPGNLIGINNADDRAIDGIVDEMRASDVVRSSDWIRATYLTTASNDVFAAYGIVEELDRDSDLPLVYSLSATEVTPNSAALNGELVSTGAAPAFVSVYWGTVDGDTNAVSWAHEIAFPGVRSEGALATNLTGLASAEVYYYRYYATNAYGVSWSPSSKSFSTYGPPSVENTGETSEVAYAFLNGTVATNGAVTYGTVYWGEADGGTNAAAWANTNVLSKPIQDTFSADTRPLVNWGTGLTGLDINNPGQAGSTSETGGVWTISGGGANIWGTADQFHYAHRPSSGDFDVHCRVSNLTGGSHGSRKAVIMLRQSLAAGSRHVGTGRTAAATNAGNRVFFLRRTTDGGISESTGTSGFTNAYYWLRLVRDRNTYSGFRAEDEGGTPGSWTQVGASQSFEMDRDVNLGIAVTAHNNGQLTTVECDNFGGGVPGMGHLVYGVPYYYRCYATNAFGERWADDTEPFLTAPPSGVGIANETPAGMTDDSVTFNGSLNATGSVFDVSLLWGATDGGTDPRAWANTNVVGSYTNVFPSNLSTVVTGLTQGTWYGTFLASNAATNMIAAPSERFQPLGSPAISNQAPTDVTESSATLNGFLAAGGTGSATVYWGMTDGEDNPVAWAATNAVGEVVAPRTMQASATGLKANGAYYSRWYVTNAVGVDWADPSLVFTTAPPAVAIGDVALMEGNDGSAVASFGVKLSNPSAIPVSVDFSTSNGTALAGSDYVATNGTLTIAAGQTNGNIDVRIAGDTQAEGLYEDFSVNIANPVDCTLADAIALCTIEDDDFGTIADAWNYRMKIVLSGYTGAETLTNFAALVKLDESMSGFKYGQFASATGDDLRFTDARRVQMLSHEVELWEPSGTSYVWVCVPEVSGSNTVIWAYWGNSEAAALSAAETSATWGDEYLGVYHLHADADDSTTNANHGADWVGSGTLTRQAGIAGNAIDVEGGAHVNLQGGARWDRLDSDHVDRFTISTWVNPDTLASDQTVFGRYGGQFLLWLDIGDGLVNFVIYSPGGGTRTSQSAGSAAKLDEWQYVVATGDSVKMRVYVDGQFGSASGGDYDFAANTRAVSLGTEVGGVTKRPLDGSLDEARIAAVTRSDDWIMAEYKNVAEHATFVTYGAVESITPGTLLLVR